jgi:hypothetical protein
VTGRYLRVVAVPVSLLVTLTTTGFAEESTSGQSAAYNQVMSANPFGLILVPWYNGEYERKATVGLGCRMVELIDNNHVEVTGREVRHRVGSQTLDRRKHVLKVLRTVWNLTSGEAPQKK